MPSSPSRPRRLDLREAQAQGRPLPLPTTPGRVRALEAIPFPLPGVTAKELQEVLNIRQPFSHQFLRELLVAGLIHPAGLVPVPRHLPMLRFVRTLPDLIPPGGGWAPGRLSAEYRGVRASQRRIFHILSDAGVPLTARAIHYRLYKGVREEGRPPIGALNQRLRVLLTQGLLVNLTPGDPRGKRGFYVLTPLWRELEAYQPPWMPVDHPYPSPA